MLALVLDLCVCNCMVIKATAQYVFEYCIDRETFGLIFFHTHSVPVQLFQTQEVFLFFF